MAARYVPLMEFVGKGKEANNADALCLPDMRQCPVPNILTAIFGTTQR